MTDHLTTAQLFTEARRHMESWQALCQILNTAPPGSLTPQRRRQIWETSEHHADLAAARMDLARLQMAEEDAARDRSHA